MMKKRQTIQRPFDIPAEGMLGLLALGAEGLVAWREKRAAVYGQDWRDKLAAELANQAQPDREASKTNG